MSSVNRYALLVKGKLTNDTRYGEDGPIPACNKRFQYNGKDWLCRTRKNQYPGPFPTFMEAEKALVLYLRRCGIVRYSADPKN